MSEAKHHAPEPRRLVGVNIVDLAGGLLLALIGAGVIAESLSYPLGTMRNIGPGMFPLLLGIVLMGLGIAIVLEGRTSRTVAPAVPWRPLFAICAGLAAFGLLIDKGGAYVAIFALILLSGLAERRPRFVALFFVWLALCVFTTALVVGFRGVVNMHLWPEF